MNLDYVVELIYKKTDEKFAKNPKLNKQSTTLPSFLKWDRTEFTIQGLDFNEGWNIYLIRVTAIEKTDAKLQDNSFLLEVETSIDCVTDVYLSVSDSF